MTAGQSREQAEHARRFDYVRYDDIHAAKQTAFKAKFTELADLVFNDLAGSRAKALVLTKLEEAYMWVGKAIRDNQIALGGDGADQPKRGE